MITRDSLMTLEAYARSRKVEHAAFIAHRRLRSVRLGPHLNLQFEDERTVRYQIQEVLRIERIFEEEGIQGEIDAYAPLLPDGRCWTATLLIEIPEPEDRRRELAKLLGIEARVYVEVAGQARVYAADATGLDHDGLAKTSAVHFVRFALPQPVREAVQAGAGVTLGCDHAHQSGQVQIAGATLASLVADLR